MTDEEYIPQDKAIEYLKKYYRLSKHTSISYNDVLTAIDIAVEVKQKEVDKLKKRIKEDVWWANKVNLKVRNK